MDIKKIEKHFKEAQQDIDSGKVKEILFSRGTYQVLIDDEEEYWVFLQFNEKQKLSDGFCSCSDEDSCKHLAAAYLAIFRAKEEPLHLRFASSFWKALGRSCAEKCGFDHQSYQQLSSGEYLFQDQNENTVITITLKDEIHKNLLKEWTIEREEETEETSIKFSGLPSDEIANWREGRPSMELLIELSWWGDLSKHLMMLDEEGKDYTLSFSLNEEGIPNQVLVTFDGIVIDVSLETSELISLIPSLNTVNSPLKVFYGNESASSISYDENKHCFRITSSSQCPYEAKAGIPLGNWLFVPNKGFYSEHQNDLLNQDVIEKDDISEVLSSRGKEIQKLLVDTVIHENAQILQHELSFDTSWNLHVDTYLFAIGDLQSKNVAHFGDWVYLPGEGFFPVKERQFDELSQTIPSEKISGFVDTYRSWLNTQEGYLTHLAGIEMQLTYSVDSYGSLHFDAYHDEQLQSSTYKDFGGWIYIAGQGFYPKKVTPQGFPIQVGSEIPSSEVAMYIRMNTSELELIPDFFSEDCPIAKANLIISLSQKGTVIVEPVYKHLPDYKDDVLRFYEEFVYTPDEGFCELPWYCRLPERFLNRVEIKEEGLALFLNYELDVIKEYASKIDVRLRPIRYAQPTIVSLEPDPEKRGTFQAGIKYVTEYGEVNALVVWKAMKQHQRFAFTSAGLFTLDNPKLEWLQSIGKHSVNKAKKLMNLTAIDLMRLQAIDSLDVDMTAPNAKELEKRIEQLMSGEPPSLPSIKGLTSNLRPYQYVGVKWLWFLYHHGLSGLLCDDMGLGKTHQTMALMSSIYELDSTARFLVICPTSVIYHWQEKIEEFLPGMSTYSYYGTQRKLEKFIEGKYQVLLTTYGIWRIDKKLCSDIPFSLAVIDEAQMAKNPSSRTHQALRLINASMTLGLTGTPIENRIEELKALFDIVLPNYMPSQSDFLKHYVTPIEKDGNPEVKERLQKLIRPFILRRKKEDVLSDLPAKMEAVAHCELQMIQRELYNDALGQTRGRLLTELKDVNIPVPYTHVFALLTRLKQICNHPAVYLNEVENYHKYQSGKWNLFVELLREARASSQKVVIFSQYLSMLDIMEIYMKEQNIGYASIRGATADRGEELRRFKNDPQCEVFLGSIQASGLGIDLTAASVVIHYDRWWNAARENQATDRVHRIGQTRGVQVFKLVTKNTFEDRIDALIREKGKLMEDVVGADDQHVVKLFNRDELIKLLQVEEL
jgi:superfamily II DNA or RNA helicase